MTILRDCMAFVVVLASVLLGFAQAFWIMSENGTRFATLRGSYYMSLMIMLGQADEETVYEGSKLGTFTNGLMILFLIVMMLLLLNLLIALMGDSFSKAKDRLQALHRREIMCILVDQAGGSVLTRALRLNHYRPSELIRVLKYTSDVTVEDKKYDSELEKGVAVTKELLASFPDKFFIKKKKKVHDSVALKGNSSTTPGTTTTSSTSGRTN